MELGVCYYPEQWPRSMWRKDAAQMRSCGISWVRIGDFCWSTVEPEEGRRNWKILDESLEVLAQAGMSVVMCTPTAAPPKWLVDKHPEILPRDSDGRTGGFGSRRHCTFASEAYLEHSMRICTALAERYGRHEAVRAWQIDNEIGDDDTAISHGPVDLEAFRTWLKNRYGSVEELNAAWGSVFWSAQLTDFAQVELPSAALSEASPSARLDYFRFCSDLIDNFVSAQCKILRQLSPGRDLIHNFMRNMTDFDHFRLGRHLDVAAWDSYPLGAVASSGTDPSTFRRHARQGFPDAQAFCHDLYRSVGRGRFWVMEMQTGQTSWAPVNPAPLDGMVRLWALEAFAHGAEQVFFFRWRQCPYGQEHFHSGMRLPDGSADQAFREASVLAGEISRLAADKRQPAQVAMVVDYTSMWAMRIQPQGGMFCDPLRVAFELYSAVRKQGVDVDLVSAAAPLDGYKAVIIALAMICDDKLAGNLNKFGGMILMLPRSGSRTRNYHIPAGLAPGPLSDLAGVKVVRAESLGAELPQGVAYAGRQYRGLHWRESLRLLPGTKTLAEFTGVHRPGEAAITENKNVRYLACWPDMQLAAAVIADLCRAAGVALTENLGDLRITRRGALHFAFNYGLESAVAPVPQDAQILVGQRTLGPAGAAVWTAKDRNG